MDRLLPPSNQDEPPRPPESNRDHYAELSSSNGHPTRRRNLYLAAFGANLASAASGCAMAWSSPSIPKLKEQGLIDDTQGSWLTSLLAVGASIGPFLAYRLVDRIGRRAAIILNMLVISIAWVLLDVAPLLSPHMPAFTHLDTLTIMYVARFLSGIGVGCSFMVTPLYIAEISDTLVRSALCSSMQLFLIVGFLVEYSVGPYCSATVLTAASLAPALLGVLVFACALPESPLYLLEKGDGEGAWRALQWLRQQHDVYGEMGSSQKSLEESRSLRVVSWTRLFTSPLHLKCLSYGLILIFFQQFSGINVILFYSEQVFRLTSSSLSPALISIVTGVVFMFASCCAPLLTKRFGMKHLLVTSSFAAFIFQGILAGYFYLDSVQFDLHAFKWVPVSCIVLYLCFYSIGLGPLPWAVMAEFYSPRIKAKGSALTASLCWVFAFLLTKCFPIVQLTLGPAPCFGIFSAVCALSTLYSYWILPDTTGMSLAQIQRLLCD